ATGRRALMSVRGATPRRHRPGRLLACPVVCALALPLLHGVLASAAPMRTARQAREMYLADAGRAATVVTATLVQRIDTSAFVPSSPDPSGIVYLPALDQLMLCASEVDETTGAGYHGANLWRITRTGVVQDTGTTLPFTNEPTGLGFDPGTNTLFISSDDQHRIYFLRPGPDGRWGNADDNLTSISTTAFGTDTEDPEFDPST